MLLSLSLMTKMRNDYFLNKKRGVIIKKEKLNFLDFLVNFFFFFFCFVSFLSFIWFIDMNHGYRAFCYMIFFTDKIIINKTKIQNGTIKKNKNNFLSLSYGWSINVFFSFCFIIIICYSAHKIFLMIKLHYQIANILSNW